MSRYTTYAAAALAAIPAIAIVQPAYAGQEESHKLAMQIISLSDDVSTNLEDLVKHMHDAASEPLALLTASCIIQKDDALYALKEETGLTKRDTLRLRKGIDACKERNDKSIEAITDEDFEKMNDATKGALVILACGSRPEDKDEREKVVDACEWLLVAAIKNTTMLLENIVSKEDADDLAGIITKIDHHVTIVSSHMSYMDKEAYEALAEDVQADLTRMREAMKDLKGEDYHGNEELRKFCEDKLN